MAAAIGSVSAMAVGSRANTTFTAPTGITDGDVLLIIMDTGNDPAVTPTAPSGFSAVTGFPHTMGSLNPDPFVVTIFAWTKVAASESGNYATTHGTCISEGIIYRITGCANPAITVTPTVTLHAEGASGGTNVIAPTITPTVNDSAVVWWGTCWDGFGSATAPTGTTPTYTEYANDTAGVFYSAAGILGTAGATGAKTVVSAQSDDRPWAAGHIVLNASGAAATLVKRLMMLGVGA